MKFLKNIRAWQRSFFRKRRFNMLNATDNSEEWHMHLSPASIFAAFLSFVLLLFILILGTLFLLLALVLGVICLVQYFSGRALGGFTTVILIDLIIGSIMMVSLGILGVYVGKIYEEVKARPRYIVAETTALPDRRSGRE